MRSPVRLVRHRLDDGTRDLLGKEIEDRVAEANLDPDADTAILTRIGAHALQRLLPGEVLQALRVFPDTGDHALLIENLPQQEFPPTPVTGFGDERALAATNAVHFGLIGLLELTPFAVSYENGGKLIRNVVPNPAASGTTSSWGADAEFFWHTDNPHLPFGGRGTDPRQYVPRYLTFYAVRNSEQVPTELMGLESALARLDEPLRDQLAATDFQVAAPDSNEVGPDGTRRTLCAGVLEYGVDGPRARFDRGTTHGRSGTAKAALDAWVDTLRDAPRLQPVLRPGQFFIFDNYRVLHRRRAFSPAPAAQARWFRRCYAS
ncbi:MAG TPA: TauD/TfdA family dioxygenase [Rugosimonospora sp.]|nr:TauD/TfdA family dioxygenase [Rugosimonospora sp.]